MLTSLFRALRYGQGPQRLSPGKYFIAHKFADQRVTDELLAALPADVEPVLFKEPAWSANAPISEPIVSSIISSDGLLYLAESLDRSSWMTFERDYALRARIPVFSVRSTPGGFKIRRDRRHLLALSAFASYASDDRDAAEHIVSFLRTRRHIDIAGPQDIGVGERIIDAVARMIDTPLMASGVCLSFISNDTVRSEWCRQELWRAYERVKDEKSPVSSRFILVLLGNVDGWEAELPFSEEERRSITLVNYDVLRHPHWESIDNLVVGIYRSVLRNEQGSEAQRTLN